MFGFGWLEILTLALLVLLITGTRRFPKIAHRAGRTAGFARKYRRSWDLLKTLLRLK